MTEADNQFHRILYELLLVAEPDLREEMFALVAQFESPEALAAHLRAYRPEGAN